MSAGEAGSLVPGPVITRVEDLSLGDLLFDGSENFGGVPNLLHVDGVEDILDGHRHGFHGHFVSLDDPSELRLADDRPFFTWDFKLAGGNHRLAVPSPWPPLPGPLHRPSALAG